MHIHMRAPHTLNANALPLPPYTHTSTHAQVVTRVWDCFLAEGWKVLYRVQLAILTLHDKVCGCGAVRLGREGNGRRCVG